MWSWETCQLESLANGYVFPLIAHKLFQRNVTKQMNPSSLRIPSLYVSLTLFLHNDKAVIMGLRIKLTIFFMFHFRRENCGVYGAIRPPWLLTV